MIGVVADDITGANDIGIMFAKNNVVSHVYSFTGNDLNELIRIPYNETEFPEVLILDTDSRFDQPKRAYEKVYMATKQLLTAGCTQFYNKTCSVFRGNIGSEFDAMLDALEEKFAVIVLGFPKNGRVTLDGVHYVHGKKLEDSEFRNDPVHPMDSSNLVEILQSQTTRKVTLISHEIIALGTERLREEIDLKKQKQFHYVILDVADQQSLRTIACAVQNARILCGSSALAEELSLLRNRPSIDVGRVPVQEAEQLGILCAAGSLMPQTIAQLEYLKNTGMLSYELNTIRLLDEALRNTEIVEMAEEVGRQISQGMDVILHTSNNAERVALTKQKGVLMGMTNIEVSRLISNVIADIVKRVLMTTGLCRLVIAGGDTSASVCAMLNVRGMRLWKEIEPGLPSCISFTDPPLLLVLKSGSFGRDDFLRKAMDHVREQ